MKLFAAAFLLPLVLGCPEIEPQICGEFELPCDNGVDPDGCWMGNWCLEMDTAAVCPPTCPMMCGLDMLMCPMGQDANGCEMPPMCMPMPQEGDVCGPMCPAVCNWAEEMPCPGGHDASNDCPFPDFCVPLDGRYCFHTKFMLYKLY